MVLGIFSLTFGCCITYVGIATAIAGLITGIISLKDKKPGKGMAIAGIIMSAIALVFLVFCIILVLTSDTYQDMVDEILRQIQSGSY
jgi:LytS/YehU family sensor histidine kinase